MTETISNIHKWAKQTIAFALSIDDGTKLQVPLEVTEQRGIRTQTVYEMLLKNTQAECCLDPDPQHVLMTLVRLTLEWTVQYRLQQTTKDSI